MKKFWIRCGMISFWIALIFGILYWPKLPVLSYEENAINVFAWGDILDPSVISAFEKETGIKVNLNYYSSNEELIVKLKATKGEGYDLIIPSDYAVNLLIDEDLLKPLKPEKISFWKEINPALLAHFFDPENRYSIPFSWEIFGFGIDKNYFLNHPIPSTWGMIFTPQGYKITMNNDPIEAVEFAAFYLYGPTSSLTQAQGDKIRELLIRQKQWVTAYANFRGDYFLATRNCSVVVASSSYIWRTKRLFDFVGFVVPEEGSFITIENLCIPKPSHKEHLVYQFIDFLYRPESVAIHYHTYGFFPSTLHAIDQLHLDPQAEKLLNSTKEDFQKFHFIQNLLPQEETRDIWVDVKTNTKSNK